VIKTQPGTHKQIYEKLRGDIQDYGTILNDEPLSSVCRFITRNSDLWFLIDSGRKELSSISTEVDFIRIEVGEIDMKEAVEEFEHQTTVNK